MNWARFLYLGSMLQMPLHLCIFLTIYAAVAAFAVRAVVTKRREIMLREHYEPYLFHLLACALIIRSSVGETLSILFQDAVEDVSDTIKAGIRRASRVHEVCCTFFHRASNTWVQVEKQLKQARLLLTQHTDSDARVFVPPPLPEEVYAAQHSSEQQQQSPQQPQPLQQKQQQPQRPLVQPEQQPAVWRSSTEAADHALDGTVGTVADGALPQPGELLQPRPQQQQPQQQQTAQIPLLTPAQPLPREEGLMPERLSRL